MGKVLSIHTMKTYAEVKMNIDKPHRQNGEWKKPAQKNASHTSPRVQSANMSTTNPRCHTSDDVLFRKVRREHQAREGVTQTCSLCHNHHNVHLTSETHFSRCFIIHWKCKRDQAGDLNIHLLIQRESKCRFTFINDEQLLLAQWLPVRLKVTENAQSKYSFDSCVL